MTMDKKKESKIQYKGSANSIPKYNLYNFSDGDIIDLEEEIAERLVKENIGFFFFEEKKGKNKKNVLKTLKGGD